jgi:hypothetical protein
MTWYHLVDQTGTHYIIPGATSPVAYITSQAVDGSAAIYMFLTCGLSFTIPASLFGVIVGAVPTAISVQR